MKTKAYNLDSIKCTLENNGAIRGFILKRNVTSREAMHILKNILGINVSKREDFDSYYEYKETIDDMTDAINKWLVGKTDDAYIMEYAYDCSDDQLGIFNMLPIISYLQKRNII